MGRTPRSEAGLRTGLVIRHKWESSKCVLTGPRQRFGFVFEIPRRVGFLQVMEVEGFREWGILKLQDPAKRTAPFKLLYVAGLLDPCEVSKSIGSGMEMWVRSHPHSGCGLAVAKALSALSFRRWHPLSIIACNDADSLSHYDRTRRPIGPRSQA